MNAVADKLPGLRSPWERTPFVGYAYAYPHKSAYRTLTPPVPLAEAWRGEARDALFLYLHVPFCEYRCGFCNLFTLAGAADMVAGYVRQLRCEAEQVRRAVGDMQFSRLAFGGGTPTFLDEGELAELLAVASGVMGARPAAIPASCEASPATLTRVKGDLLRAAGVDRLSLGVQTLDDAESRRLGRPQSVDEVWRAVEIARDCGFPVLNLDLIYGAPGQTVEAWMRSVEATARLRPEEIFLYPLYVRELTGLGRTAAAPSDNRLPAYRAARRHLLEAGYEQASLRMFRLSADDENEAPAAPAYCCQTDGMIGLGCGARSYTRSLHYSTEFAVGRTGVSAILRYYLDRDPARFATASHGFRLNDDERRRRFVIQSLLQADGLALAAYREEFAGDLLDDLPQLAELIDGELAEMVGARLRLTAAGLELSDAIGPWLYSPAVQRLMGELTCR